MNEHFVVTLGDHKGRQNRTRGIGAHEQIDLVAVQELLIKGSGHFWFGLIVLQNPLNATTQEASSFVDVLHCNLTRQLVHNPRGGQWASERQGATNAYGWVGLRLECEVCTHQAQNQDGGLDQHAGFAERSRKAFHESPLIQLSFFILQLDA